MHIPFYKKDLVISVAMASWQQYFLRIYILYHVLGQANPVQLQIVKGNYYVLVVLIVVLVNRNHYYYYYQADVIP